MSKQRTHLASTAAVGAAHPENAGCGELLILLELSIRRIRGRPVKSLRSFASRPRGGQTRMVAKFGFFVGMPDQSAKPIVAVGQSALCRGDRLKAALGASNRSKSLRQWGKAHFRAKVRISTK